MIAPQQYVEAFAIVASKIEASDRGGAALSLDEGVGRVLKILQDVHENHGKLMLVGNGAEASIASHLAVDFWKVGGVRALTFSDAAQLTALANDRGVESVFRDPVQAFCDEFDALFALSCSGESANILEAAAVATRRARAIVTLSGFSPDNSLRTLGDVNFYVPDETYGFCETAHALIMHCILDCWMRRG